MSNPRSLPAGMVGMGMIFDETYRPFFENVHARGLFDRNFGEVEVPLVAVGSRTGRRAETYRSRSAGLIHEFDSFAGPDCMGQVLEAAPKFVCVATPDDRHFDACREVLNAGVHLLVEKPSVLNLEELDELVSLADQRQVLAKIVYHKLLDPDHKKLRTLVHDDVLRHVNNGYCSLLEPKQISGDQFSEWISGRNPGTYVAVHYIKLIDFTFGGRLKSVSASGQRGLVGPVDGSTWDSCQLRMIYEYDSGREAAFDVHTSWVTPDNFPGYVEQEVQFRFDNGLWNGHSRKRGVECTVEDRTPMTLKNSMNNHYNAEILEPWGQRAQRGYGVEVIERFVREVAEVEFGGSPDQRCDRLRKASDLAYNDLRADRQVVAVVQALEAILDRQSKGISDCVVRINDPSGGLVLYQPGSDSPEVLYQPEV